MKSRITKLTAAAVIIILCFIGLIFWQGTSSGIALAEVLNKLQKVRTYSYQTYSVQTGPQGRKERHAQVLISQEQGIKVTLNKIDPNTGEKQAKETDYISYNLGYVLCMVYETKGYYRVKYDDPAVLEKIRGENHDPRVFVNELLACRHISLGRSVIDGAVVEGFQTQDPNYGSVFKAIYDTMRGIREVDVKLWVDAKTFLPVKLVEDIVKESGKEFHDVTDNFRWNMPVTADDFEPIIPDDYTSLISDIHYPAINEETALKGLKAFVNVVGSYPVNPADPTREEAFLQATKLDESKWKALSKEEITRMANEINGPLDGLSTFYAKLIEENRNLAYYGKTIKPSDSSKVLLRWKLDDGQYRVIFGDLSAKTVTSEELDKLEKQQLE